MNLFRIRETQKSYNGKLIVKIATKEELTCFLWTVHKQGGLWGSDYSCQNRRLKEYILKDLPVLIEITCREEKIRIVKISDIHLADVNMCDIMSCEIPIDKLKELKETQPVRKQKQKEPLTLINLKKRIEKQQADCDLYTSEFGDIFLREYEVDVKIQNLQNKMENIKMSASDGYKIAKELQELLQEKRLLVLDSNLLPLKINYLKESIVLLKEQEKCLKY